MLFHYVPRKIKELERDEQGNLIITKENLKTICIVEGLYEYPELNNKLYLQYKCISKIQNLQQFVNLKALYLESNLLKKIENLQCLTQLQSLFLQNNMITKIENLNNPTLKILNLSNNQITLLQNLSQLIELQSLSLTHNFLSTYQSIHHLKQCSPTLTNLDLSHNKIDADQRMQQEQIFRHVKCLYLIENPLVRQIKHYRRILIGNLENLLYLDQRTIDTEQRMISEAYVREGEEGLRKVKQELNKLKQQRKMQRSQQIMKDIDIHRNNKIIMFKRSIEEFKQQIKVLENTIKGLRNGQPDLYYRRKIQEECIKINEYYDMIISIEKRMGKVLTVKEQKYLNFPMVQPEQIVELPAIRQQSQSSEHSSDTQSTQPVVISQETSSNQDSVKSQQPFYEELD